MSKHSCTNTSKITMARTGLDKCCTLAWGMQQLCSNIYWSKWLLIHIFQEVCLLPGRVVKVTLWLIIHNCFNRQSSILQYTTVDTRSMILADYRKCRLISDTYSGRLYINISETCLLANVVTLLSHGQPLSQFSNRTFVHRFTSESPQFMMMNVCALIKQKCLQSCLKNVELLYATGQLLFWTNP